MLDLSSTPSDRQAIATLTGEASQPIRLHYHVYNYKTVVKAFHKLRCMSYIPWLDSWQWLYEAETKKFHFRRSYNKVPKDRRPLCFGHIFFRGETELIMDMRSFQRGYYALTFFAKRISPYAAKPYKLRLVNHIFSGADPSDYEAAGEALSPPYDHFFDHFNVLPNPTEELDEQLLTIVGEHEDPEERSQKLDEFLAQSDPDTFLPVLEELDINLDDGPYELNRIEFALERRNFCLWDMWDSTDGATQSGFNDNDKFLKKLVARYKEMEKFEENLDLLHEKLAEEE